MDNVNFPIICSVCGKPFGFWDEQEDLCMDKFIGYGSKYDLCRIRLNLCCSCFDVILDWLIPQCVNSPISEFEKDLVDVLTK